jgi:hypothetical protein
LLHWQKFTGSNIGDQKVNFGLQNALNLTYAHLQFKFFPGGYTSGIPLQAEEKGREEREEREGLEGEGRARN